MQETWIPIRPGGMNSDRVPNELGASEWQTVKNLRMDRFGRWDDVVGYKELNTHANIAGALAAVEVTEDRTDERFLLYHKGTSIYRLDYDSAAGYVGQTPTEIFASNSTISGVTLTSTATVRFFYYQGVVRITGTSEPLWYGYVDRTLFPDADNATYTQTIATWVLQKAALSTGTVSITAREHYINGSGDKSYFVRAFLIYDEGQYSLMADIDTSNFLTQTSKATAAANEILTTSSGGGYLHLSIKLPAASFGSANINKRLTGVGIVVGEGTYNLYDPDNDVVWYTSEVLDFSEELGKKYWTHPTGDGTPASGAGGTEGTYYDGTNDSRINFYANVAGDGWLGVGDPITLKNRHGSLTTTITAISYNASTQVIEYVDLTDTVGSLLNTGLGTAENISTLAFDLTRGWTMDGTDYTTEIAVPLGTGLTFWNFTDIPNGTLSNTPNYTHHVIIQDRGYCASAEDEEEDFIRYSPVNQPDNFPILSLFGTEAGDRDLIKAIVDRQGRLFIMKANSISQGNFNGSSFFKDVGFHDRGVYPTRGYISIDGRVFFMGREDVYVYAGGADPVSLLSNKQMRQYYASRVNTSSYFSYHLREHELWLHLSDGVLVWHMERDYWYIRDTTALVCTALDSDQRLLGFQASKLVTFDHSDTADETVSWYAKGRIIDDKKRQYFKKAIELGIACKGAAAFTATITDAISGNDNSAADDITPNASTVQAEVLNPRMLFKQLELELAGSGDVGIEEINLLVGMWR